jgi:iron complex transport system substrate-binding protein
MRIVSLLPAATEIVCALGLGDRLVGRSHQCDFPATVADLPALTRARVDSSLPSAELDAQVRTIFEQRLPLYELDEARLTELRPDVVVTQEACEVCAVSYDQVVGTLRRTPVQAQVVSLKPAFLGDVLRDMRTVADACDIGERGRRVVAELDARLEAARRRVPAGARPRVALVEWLAPPMLAGHWTPEIVEAAGGVPVGPEPGSPSPYATWEEIRALQPDVVVVAPCGMDLERTRHEAQPHVDTLRALAPRVFLLDGNAYLNRPGPRLVDAVEILQAWLRGENVPTHIGCAL